MFKKLFKQITVVLLEHPVLVLILYKLYCKMMTLMKSCSFPLKFMFFQGTKKEALSQKVEDLNQKMLENDYEINQLRTQVAISSGYHLLLLFHYPYIGY